MGEGVTNTVVAVGGEAAAAEDMKAVDVAGAGSRTNWTGDVGWEEREGQKEPEVEATLGRGEERPGEGGWVDGEVGGAIPVQPVIEQSEGDRGEGGSEGALAGEMGGLASDVALVGDIGGSTGGPRGGGGQRR